MSVMRKRYYENHVMEEQKKKKKKEMKAEKNPKGSLEDGIQ